MPRPYAPAWEDFVEARSIPGEAYPASVGDASWSARFPSPGADSTVYALDAHGDTLVVAGDFDQLGTRPFHSIALYDGTAWRDLGGGFPGSVRAVCWWNGLLVAGGTFRASGGAPGDYLAQWDGVAWQSWPVPLDGAVYALAVHQGNLVAGGSFRTASSDSLHGVAEWDGQVWRAFGSGISGGAATAYALLSDGDSLFVGGRFDRAEGVLAHNIGVWSGSHWSSLGAGVDTLGQVFSLKRAAPGICVGGSFARAGGLLTGAFASWESGEWHDLHARNIFHARAACQYGAETIVCGGFGKVDTVTTANHIASWEGVKWQAFGAGLYNHEAYGYWYDDMGYALAVYRGALYVGGHFTLADSLASPCLARWDGHAWSSVSDGDGLAFDAGCFLPRADSLIVGGSFFSAGDQRIGYIGAWDGQRWWPLGQGFSSDVYTLAEYHGDIIAGGAFVQADGQVANGIARWDGTAWHPLGESATPGMNSWVVALTVWHDTLYAGGFFTSVDGKPIAYLAAWDGTHWSDPGVGADQWVNALGVWNGKLVVGGAFTTIGGSPAQCVATWDGHTWDTLAGGLTSYAGWYTPRVYAVAVYQGDLVAGGDFDTSDQFGDMRRLAAWDGTRWRELGINGLESYTGLRPTSVMALDVQGTTLTAAGYVTRFGQTAAAHIARWDGSTWRALGSGVSFFYPSNGAVWALATWKDSPIRGRQHRPRRRQEVGLLGTMGQCGLGGVGGARRTAAGCGGCLRRSWYRCTADDWWTAFRLPSAALWSGARAHRRPRRPHRGQLRTGARREGAHDVDGANGARRVRAVGRVSRDVGDRRSHRRARASVVDAMRSRGGADGPQRIASVQRPASSNSAQFSHDDGARGALIAAAPQ